MQIIILFLDILKMSYLLKVLLLLFRVGVIKTHDKLALEADLVVLVEQSCLGMTNVQVSVEVVEINLRI